MDKYLAPIVSKILEDYDYAITFSIEKGILPQRNSILMCPNCNHNMTFYSSTNTWKCHNHSCQSSRSELYPLNIKKNVYRTYLSTLLLFSADIPIYTAIKLFPLSNQILYRYYAYFRNLMYQKYIYEMQTQALSFHVQIDESLFSRRKYERGRIKPQRWVFGACDNARGGRVYMVTVEKRNEDNLIPIIQSWCPQGSIINSDCWSAYRNLNNYGFPHCTVNHSENFVDPLTLEHTQRIEALWHQCKWFLQTHYYNKGSSIEEYIGEWCFRYNHQKDMLQIMKAILSK